MLGMTGTINALVRNNLAEGGSADEQLEFMQDKCSQAAELLGLHQKAKQVQPRGALLKHLEKHRPHCGKVVQDYKLAITVSPALYYGIQCL